MSKPTTRPLSRRERQIMDAVYALGEASAVQILESLPDPPGLSSIRKLVMILEEKGHLRHIAVGGRHIYCPTQPRQTAAKSAMRQALHTFFGGNLEAAVATLMSEADTELTDEQAARLAALIERSRMARVGEEAINEHD